MKPVKLKKKIDNGATEAKVELREWAIAQMGGAVNCNVCDLYAGGGEMYRLCYEKVGRYKGFELRYIDHPAKASVLHGDNRILWAKHHAGFNFIDSDAYGTPWVLLHDVMKKIDSGKFAVVITDGQFRTLQTGNLHGYSRQMIGYGGLPDNGLIAHWRDDIVRWHIDDWSKYGVTILAAKESKSMATKVFYYGFICHKT